MNKETVALNDGLVQMDLIDMYTERCKPKQQNVHSVQNALGTRSRTDHMLGYKNRLKKFKKTEIISSIHSNYDIETRNQLQKNWKKQTRPFEGKHHATKEPMSPQRGKNFKK